MKQLCGIQLLEKTLVKIPGHLTACFVPTPTHRISSPQLKGAVESKNSPKQKPTSSFGWLLYAANLCTKSWWHRVLHSQQGVLPGLLADLCSRYWKICCYLMLARLELASKCLPMLQLHWWKSECPKALTNAREILYINNSISSLTADKIVTMAIYVLSWPMW